MATLHIEHEITDLQTWLGAFGRFGEARQEAGVKAQRVAQPIDDDRYIHVELDFDTVEQAEAFKGFLESKVWSNPDASPGLGGTPRARVLTEVSTGGTSPRPTESYAASASLTGARALRNRSSVGAIAAAERQSGA
jgi:hypothetical protein